MKEIVAFLDDIDTEKFKTLNNIPILYCRDIAEFRERMHYKYDSDNLKSLIIYSLRFLDDIDIKALTRIIRAHSNLVFRQFDVGEYDERPGNDLNHLINVANTYYSLDDVQNEFLELSSLRIVREQAAYRRPEYSVSTYLENAKPIPFHPVF